MHLVGDEDGLSDGPQNANMWHGTNGYLDTDIISVCYTLSLSSRHYLCPANIISVHHTLSQSDRYFLCLLDIVTVWQTLILSGRWYLCLANIISVQQTFSLYGRYQGGTLMGNPGTRFQRNPWAHRKSLLDLANFVAFSLEFYSYESIICLLFLSMSFIYGPKLYKLMLM